MLYVWCCRFEPGLFQGFFHDIWLLGIRLEYSSHVLPSHTQANPSHFNIIYIGNANMFASALGQLNISCIVGV